MPRFQFKIAQMLEYQMIFRGKPEPIEQYIQRIGKEKVLVMSSFFANTDIMEMQKDPVAFIYNYFTVENQAFADKLVHVMMAQYGDSLQNSPITALNFINPIALYHIIDKALTLPDSLNLEYTIIPSNQIDYMKMLFAENSKIVERQATINTSDMQTMIDAIQQMLACQIADWDYSHVRLEEACLSQIFKCVYFFQYAEHSMPKHLRQFCAQNGVNDWKEYARIIIGLFLPFDEKKGATIVVPVGIPDYEKVIGILDKLSSRQDTDEDDYDFRQLRECPLYKRTDGNYMILSKLFLVEKLYKSLYFEFNAINEILPRADKVGDIKSYIGLHFAEEYLCNMILNRSFPRRCVKKSGTEYRAEGFTDSEPDFYVRNGNKAFLFECKDALFKSSTKISYDLEVIKEELRTKMHYVVDQRGIERPKAIRQLINNARRLMEESVIENLMRKDNLRIYPIIITHDRTFTSPGVNWLLNRWYRKEINDHYPQLAGHMMPLVLMDIDTLVLTCTRLQSRRFVLEHWIDNYNRELLSNDHELNQLPFSIFAGGALLAKGNDMEYMIRDLKVLVNN